MFVEDESGELRFHPLPFLTNDDVADVLQIARARILALLRRKGVITDADESGSGSGSGASVVSADATLAESEPALAQLAVASTLGTVPAGPALRRRDPITLRGEARLLHTKALCATLGGLSLHAATTASAHDAAAKEALCKYILRPPISQERVQLASDDLVRLILKRPFSDGTYAIDLRPSVPAGTTRGGRASPAFQYGKVRRRARCTQQMESAHCSAAAARRRRRQERRRRALRHVREHEGQAAHASLRISPMARVATPQLQNRRGAVRTLWRQDEAPRSRRSGAARRVQWIPSAAVFLWAQQGSNLRLRPCEGRTLPLSYAPGGAALGRPARLPMGATAALHSAAGVALQSERVGPAGGGGRFPGAGPGDSADPALCHGVIGATP